MNRTLWNHQTAAIDSLRQSIRSGNRRIVVQAPTGAGKTIIGASIVDSALTKGNRILFTVPAIELVDQTVERFYEEGIRDVGVIQAQHEMTDWSKPVQVASVQTLMRRSIPDASLALVDECHKFFQFYEEWFARPEWANRPIIGLSATPWTRGLGKHYDDLIIASTIRELIDQNLLSDFRVFAPSHPDLRGVKIVRGDYDEQQLSNVMDNKTLVADVVDTWLKHGKGRPTLCFAVDRAHARHLQECFKARGVKAGYIDAFTPKDERKAIKRAFHNGDLEVVCNVGVLTTGVDWDVRCIILARPTKSEMLFVQMVGRGLRTADGKDYCLILDHSDTHLRLGFVTDIHHDKLSKAKTKKEEDDEKAKEKPVKPPKECPKCHFLNPPGVTKCRGCGHERQAPKSGVATRDGELVEFTSARDAVAGADGKKVFSSEERRNFHAELLWYANEKGKSAGWASHTYKAKFGAWPESYRIEPRETTPETAQFIRHRNIVWARSKGARRYG